MLLDINEIKTILPHRYPMLLVDGVVELEPGKRIVGIKNVSANEGFFQGHFPGEPIMPGMLILEALAQLSCVLMLRDLGVPGSIALFTGADNVSFRRKVGPGDQLHLEAELHLHQCRGILVRQTELLEDAFMARYLLQYLQLLCKVNEPDVIGLVNDGKTRLQKLRP